MGVGDFRPWEVGAKVMCIKGASPSLQDTYHCFVDPGNIPERESFTEKYELTTRGYKLEKNYDKIVNELKTFLFENQVDVVCYLVEEKDNAAVEWFLRNTEKYEDNRNALSGCGAKEVLQGIFRYLDMEQGYVTNILNERHREGCCDFHIGRGSTCPLAQVQAVASRVRKEINMHLKHDRSDSKVTDDVRKKIQSYFPEEIKL